MLKVFEPHGANWRLNYIATGFQNDNVKKGNVSIYSTGSTHESLMILLMPPGFEVNIENIRHHRV